MVQGTASRRARKVPPRLELYSLFRKVSLFRCSHPRQRRRRVRTTRPIAVTLGADDDGGNDLGTMIKWAVDEEEKVEEEDGDGFSTFAVRSGERESVSGTVVRRTGGGDVGSTMSRAVASMQAVGDLGFGKQRKRSGSSQGEEARQLAKMSSSSIPESVTREDPTTRYELLTELGKGSYGAVYKARDLKTSELVAIKFISLTEGEEEYEEIQGEIEMLRQSRNPRRRVSLDSN